MSVPASTPGPWCVPYGTGSSNHGTRRQSVWTASGDVMICDCRSDALSLAANMANAARIVQCVNAHDEMVAALRAAEARLNQPVFNNTESAGHQAANILRADIRSALRVIRAALAKAQGAQS